MKASNRSSVCTFTLPSLSRNVHSLTYRCRCLRLALCQVPDNDTPYQTLADGEQRMMSPRIADFASIRAESRAPVAASHHLTEPNRLTVNSDSCRVCVRV